MRRLYALVFMFIVAGSANVFSMQPMFGYNQGMQSTTFNGASTIQYVDLIHELSLSPGGWAFPDTDVGSTSTQVFTLSNAGNYRAEDLAVTVTGEGFSESSRTCAANPFVMGSMSSCTVTAQFAPTAATTYNGFVNYSAPNIAKTSVTVSGTGVATASYSDVVLFYGLEGLTQGIGDYPTTGTWTANNASATIAAVAAKIGGYGLSSVASYAFISRAVTDFPAASGRVGFWFKYNSTWQAKRLFRYYVDVNNSIDIYSSTGGNVSTAYKTAGTNSYSASSGNNLIADAWYFIEATFDTTTHEQKIYIDGAQVASGTLNLSSISASGQLYLGESAGSSSPNEFIDNFMISNTTTRDFYGGGTGLCISVSSPR